MDPDTALVMGLSLAALSVPSIVSAWSDGRAPRASALTLLASLGLVLFALRSADGGYTLAEIPDVVVRVAAKWMR